VANEEDVVHLVNASIDWQLRETTSSTLTDGRASEDLQRDRVRQIVQWLRHYPERLPQIEALTGDGQRALDRARAKDQNDRKWRW
jgi:hypothetical protein